MVLSSRLLLVYEVLTSAGRVLPLQLLVANLCLYSLA